MRGWPMPSKSWNPRFVAYANSHGRDPEIQLVHDEKEWPGGSMCGFMLFISEKWETFSKLRPDLVPGTRGLDRRMTCYKVLPKEEG